jgi:hypothetical protein
VELLAAGAMLYSGDLETHNLAMEDDYRTHVRSLVSSSELNVNISTCGVANVIASMITKVFSFHCSLVIKLHGRLQTW